VQEVASSSDLTVKVVAGRWLQSFLFCSSAFLVLYVHMLV
jgi:hypothetical protein